MSICCFLVAMLQVIHCRLDHGSAVAANGGVVNDLSLGSHLHISPTWSDTIRPPVVVVVVVVVVVANVL